MYCGNCGKKIDDRAKFCPFCGTPIETKHDSNLWLKERTSGKRMNGMLSASHFTKKGKHIKKGVLAGIALACVVILGAGAMVKVNSRPYKVNRQLELGSRYLEDLDFEQAIASFQNVLKLEPGNMEALAGLGRIYESMAEAEENEEKVQEYYGQAAEFYEQMLEKDAICQEAFESLERIYIEVKDLNELLQLAEVYPDAADGDGVEKYEECKDILKKIADACDKVDYEQLWDAVEGEEFETLTNLYAKMGGKDTLIDVGEKKIGLYWVELEERQDYDVNCCIYYGDYSGNKREGFGYWIARNHFTMYFSAGEWSEDMPNGKQRVSIMEKVTQENGESALYFDETIFGAAVNGLWDGEVTKDDNKKPIHSQENSIELWAFWFNHGVYEVIGEPTPGEYGMKYLIGHIKGREETSDYYTNEEDVKRIHGVYGFTEQGNAEKQPDAAAILKDRDVEEAVQEDSEEVLRGVLSQSTGEKTVTEVFADFDGNGTQEAFFLVGSENADEGTWEGEVWFVNSSGAFKMREKEYYWVSPDCMLDFGDKKYFVLYQYFATGDLSYVWGVENGSPQEAAISGGGGSLNQIARGRELTMIESAYDFCTDGTGHTWKPYFFYWDGNFYEYGGIEIFSEQLLTYKGAKEIIENIQDQGYSVTNLYYRANGVINVNLTDGEINRNVTLKIAGDSIEIINPYTMEQASDWDESDQGGIYNKALVGEIAVYPDAFPTGPLTAE